MRLDHSLPPPTNPSCGASSVAACARRAGECPVVDGKAESLPFPDGSFDVVVSALVLCSVRDVSRSLAEIHRVLRPGGRLVYLEHVGSHTPWVSRLQRTVEPVWKSVSGGCHLTRDTESAIADAGFRLEVIDRTPIAGGFYLVEEAVRGVAIRVESTPSE